MKTTLRSLSYLVFFAVAVTMLPAATTPETVTTGKFLVLRNGRTLEGDIQLVDGQYRVRRNGGETFVPAKLAVRLFLDTEHAYQFLRGKTNLNDADERLRLARWCLDYNLRRQAEEEASVALLLRPDDAETKQLLERIRQAPTAAAPVTVPTPEPPVPDVPAKVVELTPEALGQFTHKVQPILVNACVSCHAAGRGGSFKLRRITDFPSLNIRATQENLAAVLAQINYVQPQASPLLTKAVSIHGGSEQAPLKGRQLAPYQTLEEWLRLTLATNPQLQERGGALPVPPPPATPAPEPKTVFAETKTETPRPHVVPAATVVKPPSGGDVCDPSEFNRQAHPERDAAPKP